MRLSRKFTIKRSQWICGLPDENRRKECCLGKGKTFLLNVEGYSCCLGLICRQLKVDEELLLGKTHIMDVGDTIPFLSYEHNGLIVATDLATATIPINDDTVTSVSEKEVQLMVLFLKHGIELEFID